MAPKVYRQGDVLLVRVDDVPADDGLQRAERWQVAEGEATGHAHVLEPAAGGTLLVDVDEEFCRIMGANGLLVHDEHTTIELPPGDYRAVRQREYAPEQNRLVAD